jgi:hypothetical protein
MSRLRFKDKQLLVKAVGTLFGTSTETVGETTTVEVINKGLEAVRYNIGDKLVVYSNSMMEIKSPYFKEGEYLIESEVVGRGVICEVGDAE